MHMGGGHIPGGGVTSEKALRSEMLRGPLETRAGVYGSLFEGMKRC